MKSSPEAWVTASKLPGSERWRDISALGSTDDLETRNESGRAPAGPGRGTINAEACHFVSASARRGWAGRSARPRRGRSAGVQGHGSQTAAEARGSTEGEAGARGQVEVGVPSWRAAGPGSRLPGPAGISSRLHAATRVGLGSAREKECPRRAGEAGGRARGGGAGLKEAGVAPDLGAQGVLQGVLLKRERPWLPKFSLKLRVHWGLIPKSLRLQGQRI